MPARGLRRRRSAADTPVIVTDFATAELVKVAANAFLATKISFINAIAEVCEAAGGDVTQLADAIGYDARIGRRFLNAGIGFGGGCLPKDIRAFQARADELGVGSACASCTRSTQSTCAAATASCDCRRDAAGQRSSGKRVAVLGAAFKPEQRRRPRLAGAGRRRPAFNSGAEVSVYDPAANANAAKRYPRLNYVDSLVDSRG